MTPQQFQTGLEQASRLHLANRLPEAAVIYEKLRAAAPQNFQINHLLGTLRYQQGKTEIGTKLLEQALRANPRSAATLMCLGLAYGSLGKHVEAERCLREAVRLEGSNAENWMNLGGELVLLGRLSEAVDCYNKSLALRPNYTQARAALAATLAMMGRGGDALEQCDAALKQDPDHFLARFTRAQANLLCYRVDDALADFDRHLAKNPDHLEARSYRLMTLNYRDDVSSERLFQEHADFGRRADERATLFGNAKPLVGERSGDRPIRIGILSPDLRKHSITYFLEPLLRGLDRGKFQLYFYHDHFCIDDVSKRLQTLAHAWRHVVGQSHETVFRQIRDDELDIALDVTGHTGLNRMLLYARRLAPVQVAYLGYPNTTGLKTMDYRLTDELADPTGMTDALHTEKLIRFSSCAWCYQPPASSPPVAPAPCLKNGYVTFGSFNALSKLNGYTLRLWARLLREIPDARLVLKNYGYNPERWKPILAEAGLPLERTTILPPSPDEASHLAAYGLIDVALDPHPYNGTTTTCEALWMGVPVFCLKGDRHASRVGYSLVSAVGHPEWAQENEEKVCAQVNSLISDRTRLATLRVTLREAVIKSRLMHETDQARALQLTIHKCCLK